METPLTHEIYWLIMTLLMTALFWVPYIINRIIEQGIVPALTEAEGFTQSKKAWANRMMRAHANAVENLAIFAPLVLILQVLHISTPLTVNACIIYFVARAVHFVAFSLGWPGFIRIMAFVAGVYAQLAIIFVLIL